MNEKSSEKLKPLILLLSVTPFAVGTAGYMMEGEKVSDALYYSFSLYFVNLNSDAYNIFIEIARWSSAMVMAAAVLYVLKQIWINVRRAIISFRRDSVAVYSDSGKKIRFSAKTHAVIYSDRDVCPKAKSHIIMMDTDTDSLKFFNDNKAKFKSNKVYIGLKEMDYGLIKDISSVTFYDIDGAIARNLWKSIRLWDNRKNNKNLTITILGNGHLGQSILNHGLLLNLFSLEQNIIYNFCGMERLYQIAHEKIETCNNDSVYFFVSDDDGVWDVIKKSNIVIIAEQVSIEKLQTIGIVCKNCDKNGKVYYYAPNEGDAGEYIKLDNIIPYGRDCEIYTDENIRRGNLIKQAMILNYDYAEKYGKKPLADPEEEWNKLDGFLKWSNISSADFNEVIKAINEADEDVTKDELAELEHIRWCRFHYLNHWKYGIPDNGKSKDESKKIHKDLRSYSDMEDTEKEKDMTVVDRALNL